LLSRLSPFAIWKGVSLTGFKFRDVYDVMRGFPLPHAALDSQPSVGFELRN
jgi:hypothetical protein